MSTPLLATKLHIPPLRARIVRRPRLFERLDAGLRHRLTLLSAPAGFGKTTLLSAWLQIKDDGRRTKNEEKVVSPPSSPLHPFRVAWLSLDENDNDPARFRAYLVAALRCMDEKIGNGVPGTLQTRQSRAQQRFLAALINQLNATAGELLLVLDDYHVIAAQPVHDMLTFLLDNLPANAHLIIATRADPPLPLARLRARGQLVELRSADLRFTHDEAAEFLNRVMGLGLSSADIAALEEHTEGWIAGLQLAALSMQGQEDVSSFIRAFTGSHRYILDYLADEVLARQPEAVQAFLADTSILERLSGPLCDAIAGRSDSQAMLEGLERANLFVVPLDAERRWYRYHRLFADFLQVRQRQLEPERLSLLHRRAADWYEQNGLASDAVGHALAAKDFRLAARLIEGAAEALFMRSEVATFHSWVEALPDDVVRARPLLCVYQAPALILSGLPLEAAEACLQDAIAADTAGAVAGHVAAFRALIAAYRGDMRACAELSQQALELLPKESLFFRSFVTGYLGLASLYGGDVRTATSAFSVAASESRRVGNLMNAVLALCHLAELSALQGQLRRARHYCDQALESAVDAQGRRQPIAGLALIGVGRLLAEQNELDAAQRYLLDGIELINRWGEAGAISGYIVLAQVRQAKGDAAGAREAMQKAQRLAQAFDAMEMDDIVVGVCKVPIEIVQGNLEAAACWIEGRGLDESVNLGQSEGFAVSTPLLRALEYIALAQVRIAQGRPDDALKILRPLLQGADAAGWVSFVAKILVLQSLAFRQQGDTAQALGALGRALALCEPEGGMRVFLDEGAPMARLLYEAAAQGIRADYARRLLAAFPASEPRAVGSPEASKLQSPMVEPLSARELEVLQLIAEGLSNQEIAQRLFISLRTVKWHTGNIYGKLGVEHRTQAIARARVLGILPGP
jgi:LuxR family maltose regulon positive regulatory protein